MQEGNKNLSINLIWALIIIGGIFWFLLIKHDSWRGFYYPGGILSGPVVYSPEYKTKEDCISWAENEWKSRSEDAEINPQNLYECGKNCKVQNKEIGLHVCEKTFDGGDWRRGNYGD